MRDYTLRVRLGAGGMGEVWLATDEGPHGFRKNVVLKTMLPEAARFLDYFTSEARLGARLHHQNLVNVLDFFVEGGRHYLVLEYVEGIDLLDLTEQVRLTPEQSVYIACAALRGLGYAHEVHVDGRPARIVHRDISPDNILLSLGAEVKVTDFGIAKAEVAWRERTTGNPFKGKWGYVSPEMLLGQDVDARADIYQMGVVLYEMLTGRRAFPGGSSTYHLAAVIVEGKIPPLSQVAPGLPNSLAAVVECMMHPERDQRMATADAARTALMKALPEHVHAERSLGELVRRATAARRRPTSPFLRPGEGVVSAPDAPAVVMGAAPLDETVRVASSPPSSASASAPPRSSSSAPSSSAPSSSAPSSSAPSSSAPSSSAPSSSAPSSSASSPSLASSEGVPSAIIVDEPHELRLAGDDESKEPLHVVRRRLRASRVGVRPVNAPAQTGTETHTGTPTGTPTQTPALRIVAFALAFTLALAGAAFALHHFGVWP